MLAVEQRSSADLMLRLLEGDTFRLCSHHMWLGQASWANLLYALSVTLGGGASCWWHAGPKSPL